MMVENVNFAPSAAGDIVLNTHRQKSKKWLVAGVVVAVLAVIFITIAAILNVQKPADRDISYSQINRYLNYLILGTEDDTTPNIKISLYNTKAYSCYNNGENCDGFFDKGQEILEQVASAYKTDDDNNSLPGYIETQKTQLTAIREFISADQYNSDVMVARYISTATPDIVTKEIEASYSSMTDSGNPTLIHYAEIQNAAAKNSAEIAKIFRNNKCIKNGSIVDGCLRKDQQDAADVLFAKNQEFDNAAASITKEIIANFYSSAQGLYELIVDRGVK